MRHSASMSYCHYLNQCWNIVNWTLGNKLRWNLDRNSYIFIKKKVFWKCHLQKWQPACLDLSVLMFHSYCPKSSGITLKVMDKIDPSSPLAIIPMYRLWLHGLYKLYEPRCLLSKKALKLNHSLTHPQQVWQMKAWYWTTLSIPYLTFCLYLVTSHLCVLTHCGPVVLNGKKDLGQHWLR